MGTEIDMGTLRPAGHLLLISRKPFRTTRLRQTWNHLPGRRIKDKLDPLFVLKGSDNIVSRSKFQCLIKMGRTGEIALPSRFTEKPPEELFDTNARNPPAVHGAQDLTL
jgi:hypothetical protein